MIEIAIVPNLFSVYYFQKSLLNLICYSFGVFITKKNNIKIYTLHASNRSVDRCMMSNF